ncbi:hypothetical protein D3C87_1357870 [compost metagenome]
MASIYDWLHRQLRLSPSGGANYRQNQIEFRCVHQHIKRITHYRVASPSQGQVDDRTCADLDFSLCEATQCIGTRSHDIDITDAELVHGHRRPTTGGSEDSDSQRSALHMGNALKQRSDLKQTLKGFHSSNTAVA